MMLYRFRDPYWNFFRPQFSRICVTPFRLLRLCDRSCCCPWVRRCWVCSVWWDHRGAMWGVGVERVVLWRFFRVCWWSFGQGGCRRGWRVVRRVESFFNPFLMPNDYKRSEAALEGEAAADDDQDEVDHQDDYNYYCDSDCPLAAQHYIFYCFWNTLEVQRERGHSFCLFDEDFYFVASFN